jgi:large subunit ribosomal protein L6
MSRIGKKPILIPKGVEVKVDGDFVFVKGPKGELSVKIHSHVNIAVKENEISISVENPEIKDDKALWGLYGSLLRNMVAGVTSGFEKKLEINGVGYKVQSSGDKLVLHLGFSHPVDFMIPKNISIVVDKNIISISGADKQLVGQTAASIRALKPPEPYKGKGIKYSDEIIKRKAGKAAKAAGGGAA